MNEYLYENLINLKNNGNINFVLSSWIINTKSPRDSADVVVYINNLVNAKD